MSTYNGEDPAFPSHGSMGEVIQEGMSLRDYAMIKIVAVITARTMTDRTPLYKRLGRWLFGKADSRFTTSDAKQIVSAASIIIDALEQSRLERHQLEALIREKHNRQLDEMIRNARKWALYGQG